MFDNVSSRSILDQVPAKLKGETARSLWRRVESEFASGGPGAVSSYLNSQFDEISTRLHAALSAVKDQAAQPRQ